MPALFVGHGSPMNGIEETEFGRAWEEVGRTLPRPAAILCISAHWESDGTLVCTTSRPETIHDFYGFPDELHRVVYPAPGAPEWAEAVRRIAPGADIRSDPRRGLDHGTWVVLRRMFPKADVPVFQISLDRRRSPQEHYELARQLGPLRDQGLLIVGSGNMVHNLRLLDWSGGAHPWATAFDQQLAALIRRHDHAALIDYPALGANAVKAIPTNEHYLPMLWTLALRREGETPQFFAEGVTLGSISMRSFRIG